MVLSSALTLRIQLASVSCVFYNQKSVIVIYDCCQWDLNRACGLVLGFDVEDAVGVEVEGDADLGDPPRSGGDPRQLKLAEQVVVARAAALSLEHLDQHGRLVVAVRAEHLRAHARQIRQPLLIPSAICPKQPP